jgi:hypothetical protein
MYHRQSCQNTTLAAQNKSATSEDFTNYRTDSTKGVLLTELSNYRNDSTCEACAVKRFV